MHTLGKLYPAFNAVKQQLIMVEDGHYSYLLATINEYEGSDPKANAEHICNCVNNHDRLVEALESLLSLGEAEGFGIWEDWEEVKEARQAIAAVK